MCVYALLDVLVCSFVHISYIHYLHLLTPATDRVMTCSFHKYGDFFPGSGHPNDRGHGEGMYTSINFPLKDGLDDESFEMIFKPIMDEIMAVYKPGAVVICCGADSIAGDKLGRWNLSLNGHGGAINHMKSFGVPVVLLGGGGYTPRNVARAWTFETAIALGVHEELDHTIPQNLYMKSFRKANDHHCKPGDLWIRPSARMPNKNSRAYLEKYKNQTLEAISRLKGAPSVQMQDVPRDYYDVRDADKVKQENREEMEERVRDIRENKGEFYKGESYNALEGFNAQNVSVGGMTRTIAGVEIEMDEESGAD